MPEFTHSGPTRRSRKIIGTLIATVIDRWIDGYSIYSRHLSWPAMSEVDPITAASLPEKYCAPYVRSVFPHLNRRYLMKTNRGMAALLVGMTVASACAVVGAPVAHAAPSAFYVDCAASSGGDGTAASPWNTLGAVNSHTFGPGDRLLFKRGTSCLGTLSPQGSGSATAPFTISDYGSGANRAVIDGNGSTAAVHLVNVQHVALTDLVACRS